MTLPTEAKILRALHERALQRVGGTQTIKVDVRIIASTNKDLDNAVREGTFRDDLYFRLNVVTINVPRLRDRRDEIPELGDHFLAEANARLNRSILRLARDTLAALMEYGWPGNVRELRNMIERAAVVNDGDVLVLSSFPPPIRPSEPPVGAAARWDTLQNLTLDEKVAHLERAFVVDALARAGGIQAAAARLLGVTERSVWHLGEEAPHRSLAAEEDRLAVLGDALLASGAITPAQLEQALAQQRTSGALLIEIVLSLNVITEETLARALARGAGVPFLAVEGLQPDPAAVALVPEQFARKHLLAPLSIQHYTRRTLVLTSNR